jgi:hypothetical protein
VTCLIILARFGSCGASDLAQSSSPPSAPSSPGAMPTNTLMLTSTHSGPVMRITASDVAPLVLHGRHLNEVSVSTVAELTAAVGNSAVDKILVAAGTYSFTTNMCTDSAICIDRAVTIEAQVPGSVVLDANGGRRVFEITSGGTLIGLNITGGDAQGVSARSSTFQYSSSIAQVELDLALAARRAVVSVSQTTERPTLKAAISMTTPLLMCACILNLP